LGVLGEAEDTFSDEHSRQGAHSYADMQRWSAANGSRGQTHERADHHRRNDPENDLLKRFGHSANTRRCVVATHQTEQAETSAENGHARTRSDKSEGETYEYPGAARVCDGRTRLGEPRLSEISYDAKTKRNDRDDYPERDVSSIRSAATRTPSI
jgi:hypothetical protein